MKHYSASDIEDWDKHFKINLINSLSGVRPACLIGTVSANGQPNAAIFNSVMHIGSSPALIGFFMRPVTVERHTFSNILANSEFTINHVSPAEASRAHHTSAKFEGDVSKFEACGLTAEYLPDFAAPFVAGSPLRIGARFVEHVPIHANNTSLVIGAIEHILLEERGLMAEGHLDMEQLNVAGVSGLDTYYRTRRIATFRPAEPNQKPILDPHIPEVSIAE